MNEPALEVAMGRRNGPFAWEMLTWQINPQHEQMQLITKALGFETVHYHYS